MIEQTRIDSWLVKGFEGIANMVISRSNQGKIPKNHLELLEQSVRNLNEALRSEGSGTETDTLMFSLLLKLTTIVLARMKQDSGMDGANISHLCKHIATFEKALMRFREHEFCNGGAGSLE